MEIMDNLEKRIEELEKRVSKNEKAISDLFKHLVERIKTDIEFGRKLGLLAAIIEKSDKLIKVSTATTLWIANRLGPK